MKAQDWIDPQGARADMVNKLIEFCVTNNLNYTFTEKKFTVGLPGVEPVDIWPKGVKKRKVFNIDSWGPTGPAEDVNMPDELPPTITPLDEGTPPQGDPDAER